jgi:hypothetical protein
MMEKGLNYQQMAFTSWKTETLKDNIKMDFWETG